MIVHIKKIIKKAQKGNYAIGAFNTSNLEMTLGIIRAAVAKKSAVIIQISESTIKYAGLPVIVGLVNKIAETEGKNIPIAVHLDHGRNLAVVKECVQAGFSSVHLDASEFSFKKNMALTKKAVAYAHQHGVWVQGELGSLLGAEGKVRVKLPQNPNQYLTDPDKVKEFVQETKVDTLAVSVGTMHGLFRGEERIDFKRLTAISKQVKVPLVLHGASGVNHKALKKSIKKGIKIINLDTALRLAFTQTLQRNLMKRKSFYDPRKILSPAIKAVQKVVEQKIVALGSVNKK